MATIGAIHNGLVANHAPQITAVAFKGVADGYDEDVVEVRWTVEEDWNTGFNYVFSDLSPDLTGSQYDASGVASHFHRGDSFISAFPLGFFAAIGIHDSGGVSYSANQIWLFRYPTPAPILEHGSYFEFHSDYVPPPPPSDGGHFPTGSGVGQATYVCQFGDGTSYEISRTLPDVSPLSFPHTYREVGAYTVRVTQYLASLVVRPLPFAFSECVVEVLQPNFTLALRVLAKDTQFL